MPRVCTICSHPDRIEIDSLIANSEPYLRIAKKFGLNDVTVGTHAKNHVQSVLDALEQGARDAIAEKRAQYYEAVYLPLPDKSVYIENKLWADYYAADKTSDKMAVMREIQKQQAEQAKLAGEYTQDKKNPADNKTIIEETIRELMAENIPEEQIREVLAERYPETVH